jgi:hypothetical protein
MILSDEKCEKACEILQATQDGNLLSPQELSLTEGAVNDWLTEEGEKMFTALYQTVVIDKTLVPFTQRSFRGLENITADSFSAGGGLWILWKGICIEHYDMPWAYSDRALEDLKDLKHRCEILESQGKPISTATVIWNWEEVTDYKEQKLC